MTIEIHEPELEALIGKRMATGAFETIEDALLQALRLAPLPANLSGDDVSKSGLEVFEALQRCPHPDVDIEPSRPFMPVKEFTW
jgi:hypothetical protein